MATKDKEYLAVSQKDPEKEALEEIGGEKVELKKTMSMLNGVTVIVGSIIGSGIFVSPSGVLKNTGSVNMALCVWVASGIFSLIGATCYAELGCMIKNSGADYAYIMITFGRLLAFLRLWVESIIIRPGTIAIVSMTFSIYALKPIFPECDPPEDAVRYLAALAICFLSFINCWSVKWATFIQDIFTYAKLLALFVIIATGIVQLSKGKTENFTWTYTEENPSKITLSFYSGLFAYNGWNYLNFVIEEMKNPVRDLPRAIGISCILVTLVYVMANVAFYTTLNTSEVLGSEAVAVMFASRLYGSFAFLIPIAVAMSTFGGVNGILLTASRLFYAGACEGQLPEICSMIQVTKMTPAPSVIVVGGMSICYLCVSDIFQLMNYVGFATWLSIGVAVSCLPYLRWKHPEWERPIKVPLILPIIYIICSILVTLVPMMSAPGETGIGLAMILTGIPVYYIFISESFFTKPDCLKRFLASVTILLQKLVVVVAPQ